MTVERSREVREGHPAARSLHIAFIFLYVIVGCLCVVWLGSNVKQVSAGEQAIVARMGRVIAIRDEPGMVFALPAPIDEVHVLPAPERRISIVVKDFSNGDSPDNPKENKRPSEKSGIDPQSGPAYLLTQDAGVVHLEGALIATIIDPVDYGLGIADVQVLLRRFFAAAAIQAVAETQLEELMVRNLETTRQRTVELMRKRIDSSPVGIGVQIERVDLTVALPRQAKDAFDQSESAKAESSRIVAQANKSARITAETAQKESQVIRNNASSIRQELLAAAHQATGPIDAERSRAFGSHRRQVAERLYRDSMEKVFQSVREWTAWPQDRSVQLVISGRSPIESKGAKP